MEGQTYYSVTVRNVQEDVDNKGKGLFASELLHSGDEAYIALKPVLTSLDTARLLDTCYHCGFQPHEAREAQVGRTGGNSEPTPAFVALKVCAGCKTVRFCDQKCQKRSWRFGHATECPLFKQLHPKVLPNHMRAVCSFLLQPNIEVCRRTWSDLDTCEPHLEEIINRQDQEFFDIVQMSEAVKKYTKTRHSFEEILLIFCRLKINSFTLTSAFFDPLGMLFDPVLAKLNHSCTPNACIRPRVGKGSDFGAVFPLILCPLRTIDKDEEITVSYIEEIQPYDIRQRELFIRYFFKCTCAKCVKEHFEVTTIPEAVLEAKHELRDKIVGYIDSAAEATSKYMPIQKLQYALHLMAINNWNVTSYPFPQALQKLIVAFIDDRQFNHAMAHAMIQYFDVDPDIYSYAHHPIRLIHLYTLVRLITVIFDGNHSDPNDQSLKLAQHMDIQDLKWWRVFLAKKLASEADGLYSSTRNIYHMQNDFVHADMYGRVDISTFQNQEFVKKKYRDMKKLTVHLYATMKDKTRWEQ